MSSSWKNPSVSNVQGGSGSALSMNVHRVGDTSDVVRPKGRRLSDDEGRLVEPVGATRQARFDPDPVTSGRWLTQIGV
jgi:hypothetical protein